MRHLILGSGPAGIAAANAIREKRKDDEILIITEDRHPPYLRPFLSDFIGGGAMGHRISDPRAEGLSSRNIFIHYGREATGLSPGECALFFSDGTKETYDFLLLATGGRPVAPPQLEGDTPLIISFDSLTDAMQIRERGRKSSTSVVYGPGYLAIEATRAMRKLGHRVTWFKPPMPGFGYPIEEKLESDIVGEIRKAGVDIREGIDIEGVEEAADGILNVRGAEGKSVQCQMLILATERQPAVSFLAGSDIRVDRGVQVDDYLRTSVSNVYAAGDCAEVYEEESGSSMINFGWKSAIKQGQLAGTNMAGDKSRYIRKREDYFWLIFGPSLSNRIE